MNISSPQHHPPPRTYRFSAATSCLRTRATQINLKCSIRNTIARNLTCKTGKLITFGSRKTRRLKPRRTLHVQCE